MMRSVTVSGLALALVSTALAAKPSKQELKEAKKHFEQGRVYQDSGAYDDAIREYEKAYSLAPLPQLLFNIGQTERLKGDKPKAIEAYEKYLGLVPEGDASDEAREHIAALKLKIQVEEAEAARKRAEEEAAQARRREEEARRAQAQAAETRSHDEERLRRLAVEMNAAEQRRKAANAEALRKRVEVAGQEGRGWRIAGLATILAGVVTMGLTVIPLKQAANAQSKLREFNEDEMRPWSTELDDAISDTEGKPKVAATMAAIGGGLILTGIVLRWIGGSIRENAEEEARKSFRVQF